MILPVITLWQPWAQFIAAGWKTIETRTHSRFSGLETRTILIHAGAQWDKDWLELAGPYMNEFQKQVTSDMEILKPQILCAAKVYGVGFLNKYHSPQSMISCNPFGSRYGLFLEYIQNIEPILVKGKQGIWYYDLPHEEVRKLIQ